MVGMPCNCCMIFSQVVLKLCGCCLSINKYLIRSWSRKPRICKISEENKLISILECKNIYKQPEIYFEHNDHKHFWIQIHLCQWICGAFKQIILFGQIHFCNFLQKNLANSGAEFYIPELIQDLIDTHKTEVHVLHSSSSWIGVTYKEDKPMVEKAFNDMIQAGIYPEKL